VDLATLSRIYRGAWRKGLKTTYYLRTLSASNIEASSVIKEKELRGVVSGGGQSAAAAGNAPADPLEYAAWLAAQRDKAINGKECEACT
jgi:ribonucleoside-diphosphate reductase alpha chain